MMNTARNRFTNNQNRGRGARSRGRARGRASRGGRPNNYNYNNNNPDRNDGYRGRGRGRGRGMNDGGYRGRGRGMRGGRGRRVRGKENYNYSNNRITNNRGRGTGQYNQNSGCFKCGEQGHFSRECPNNPNNHYRNNNRGHRGRGRGGRGRGRGRGGRNSGFKGHMDPSQRFHDDACENLLNEVAKLNEIDVVGPQQVRVKVFTNNWQEIESLSLGKPYYYRPRSSESTPKTSFNMPECCNNAQVREEYYQDQGSSFAKPPPLDSYPPNLYTKKVHSNSYHIRGDFLNNTVHTYLVEFEPPIPSQHRLQRRRAIYGTTRQQRNKNRDLLREKFGEHVFDNNHLLSMGAPAYKTAKCALDLDTHRVIFIWLNSANLNSADLEIIVEDQLLNTFKKQKMRDAGFQEVRRRWFYKDVHNPPALLHAIRPTRMNNKVTLLHGFECRVGLVDSGDKDCKKGILKADLANKQISSHSVHEIIADIGMERGKMIGSEPFISEVRRQLVGKFFIMSYNCISFKICEIVFAENEKTEFEWRNGKISYGGYLKKQYDIKVPRKEICVLKDFRGSAYLPQFAYLTLRSDEIDDLKVSDYTNPGVGEELLRVNALVTHLNKTQSKDSKKSKGDDDEKSESILRYGLNMNDKPIRTSAVILQYPEISIMAFRGIKTTQLTDFVWGGRDGTKGFLLNVKKIKKWIIIGSDQRMIDQVFEIYKKYIGMRAFDGENGPLQTPQTQIIDFNDVRNYKTIAKGKWQLIFAIIPDDKGGSQIKTLFSKELQGSKTAPVIQCMQESTVFGRSSRDSILGAFEQAMGKYGNVLYQITPKLQPKSPYKLGRIWMIGIAVSHNYPNPTVAGVTLLTMPFYGTQRGLRSYIWLNTPRKEIIPYAATATCTYKLLRDSIEQIKDPKTRPEIIMVFRDGVQDNGLKEVHSKEVVGVQRGIGMLAAELDCVWKPKIQFIVVSKDPIDKFGVLVGKNIQPLTVPAVVYSGITSTKLFDFLLWGFHPNSDIKKIKPKRYVVLKDELKLHKAQRVKGKGKKGKKGTVGVKGAVNFCMDLYHIIVSASYTYHAVVPFIQGGTSQPGPITYAKHYAEKFSQMITKNDQSLKDLHLSKNLKIAPQIVRKLIDLDAKQQRNINGKKSAKKATPTAKNGPKGSRKKTKKNSKK